MKLSRIFLALLVISVLASTNALAGRTWYYNQVEFSNGAPAPTGNTAIAMRSGNTWPVVAYSDNGMPSGVATMIPGNWVNSAGGFTGQYIDSATANDGTVAFADNQGNIRMLTKSGFTSAFYAGSVQNYKPSMAFNNSNSPGVLHSGLYSDNNLYLTTKTQNVWSTSRVEDLMQGPVYTNSFALDFDSYNQANIIFEQGGQLRFGIKGALTQNQWVFSGPNPNNTFVNGPMDMELTSNDTPFAVYTDGMFLKYSTYDIQRDTWSTGVLDAFNSSNNFCIASDSAGGIGIAYITQFAGMNMLSYAYNNGSGWMGTERVIEADITKMVGLTFDYQNNPVISYGQGGYTYIAYDPVVTPEPATMILLTLGAALIRRKG